jgi:hypothetical protein
MGLFKSADEKAAEREAAAQRKALKRERAKEARYLSSPLGRASTAHSAGASILQLEIPVGDDGSKTIADIEAIGWQLQTIALAYELSFNSSTNGEGQLASIDTSSRPMGLYLFRRT